MDRNAHLRGRAAPTMSVEPSFREGAARVQVHQPVQAEFVIGMPGITDLICTPISATIAALSESAELTVKFPVDGFVVSFSADVVSPGEMSVALTPEVARTVCGVKVTDGDTRGAIISDGESERAVVLSAAFGGQLQRVYPINKPVRRNAIWRVRFSNLHGTSNNLKAQAAFGFRADAY